MTEEKELLTILSKAEYAESLKKLTKQFGKPKRVKRLALQCTDYRWADVDTRIRITNGQAEIIQKLGDWKHENRHELTVKLPSNANRVFDTYKIFMNMMRDEQVLTPIMQLENLIYETADFEISGACLFEIKLTHQFGKTDAYNCEIEVFDHSLEPKDLAEKLEIPIHLPEQTQDFWKKWNEKVNLDARKLSDKELLEIIAKYL